MTDAERRRAWEALRAEYRRLYAEYDRLRAERPSDAEAHAALSARLAQHRKKLAAGRERDGSTGPTG